MDVAPWCYKRTGWDGMDGLLGGLRYKGPYGAKNGSVSQTNLGGKRGKRRFHQPTFTQWTRKSLLKHTHQNVGIFCQYFPHVLHLTCLFRQVLAGALESHWNSLTDDEDYKKDINANPTIFRMRSPSTSEPSVLLFVSSLSSLSLSRSLSSL